MEFIYLLLLIYFTYVTYQNFKKKEILLESNVNPALYKGTSALIFNSIFALMIISFWIILMSNILKTAEVQKTIIVIIWIIASFFLSKKFYHWYNPQLKNRPKHQGNPVVLILAALTIIILIAMDT